VGRMLESGARGTTGPRTGKPVRLVQLRGTAGSWSLFSQETLLWAIGINNLITKVSVWFDLQDP
jgi:hypothetical protein